MTLEELVHWLPLVPDSENQALILTNAFAAYVSVYDVPDLPARNVRLDSRTKRWFQYDVARNQVALERLREALKLKQSRYPADWAQGWETDLPHLSYARSLAQILCEDAALHANAQQPDKAVNSVAMIYMLARSLDLDPCQVSQRVRADLICNASHATERLVNQIHLTDARLSALQGMFHDDQASEPCTRALVAERCFGLDLFQQPKEKFVALLEMLNEGGFASNNVPAVAEAFVANRDADYLFYLEAMERLVAASQLPDSRQVLAIAKAVEAQFRAAAAEPLEKRLAVSTFLVTEFSHEEPPDGTRRDGPAMWFTKQMWAVALMRTAEVAMAVERYRLAHNGQLPSDLDALTPEFLPTIPTDPFDGRPLRYARVAKGYVIYSVGADGQDNGGKEAERASKAGEDGTDITFAVERAGNWEKGAAQR